MAGRKGFLMEIKKFAALVLKYIDDSASLMNSVRSFHKSETLDCLNTYILMSWEVMGSKSNIDICTVGQCIVDEALRAISRELLHNLFLEKKKARARLNCKITVGYADEKPLAISSVSRSDLSSLLKRETNLQIEVDELKSDFNIIINAAKEFGFEVYVRDENQYHIYSALKIDLNETKDYFAAKW